MRTGTRKVAALAGAALMLGAVGCGSSAGGSAHRPARLTSGTPALSAQPLRSSAGPVPSLVDPHNVYAADAVGHFSAAVAGDRPLIYVPNSASATVTEIDPTTYQVVREFPVGAVPQHVVPAYDLRTLWVNNDVGNSLTPIDPRTGIPGRPVPVDDPYNMYYTPDGRFAMIMAEALRRIDFRDPHTMAIRHQLSVSQCPGVNHADFTADGRLMFVSCEFGARMIVVDVAQQRVLQTIDLPPNSSPQDVKLSPDGTVFYVADLHNAGVWRFDAHTFRRLGLIATGSGAHGLYPSRDATVLYVSNRQAGTISVISFATGQVIHTWPVPGGSPDMGGVSASGRVLWLSGRYDAAIYAIDTTDGHLIRRIPVGDGPHGLCVFPQPGRYSLGHTGVYR